MTPSSKPKVTCPSCHQDVELILIDGAMCYQHHLIGNSEVECQFSEKPVLCMTLDEFYALRNGQLLIWTPTGQACRFHEGQLEEWSGDNPISPYGITESDITVVKVAEPSEDQP